MLSAERALLRAISLGRDREQRGRLYSGPSILRRRRAPDTLDASGIGSTSAVCVERGATDIDYLDERTTRQRAQRQ